MEIFNALDKSPVKIETYPYKGKPYKVKEVWIRWLSQAGPKDSPEYGLRFFTIGPAGEIPIHNHFYYQTMFILSGRVAVFSHESETARVKEERDGRPFRRRFRADHGTAQPQEPEPIRPCALPLLCRKRLRGRG